MTNSVNPDAAPRARTEVTCSKCGKQASVPFVPTPGRPVFCRDCFSKPPGQGDAPPRSGARAPRPSFSGGRRGGSGGAGGGTPRQRMMAQGRKGHFIHDARAVLQRTEGGMEEQHVRAFLEGLFARGARTSTAAAQEFLDTKVDEGAVTPEQRKALGDLVERYSFWR